jgi:hypothetical protein
MTTLEFQRFGFSSGAREARALERLARSAADGLGDRAIWLVDPPLPSGARAPRRVHVPTRPPEGPPSAERIEDEDLLAGGRLTGDDLVLLRGRLALTLAPAIREHGAHTILLASDAGRLARQAAEEPSGLPAGGTHALDAYVVSWHGPRRPGGAVTVAAFVPSAELLAARQIALGRQPSRRAHLAWSSLLADVVGTDRHDCVGGTIHARPAVAGR